jgi:type II secretory pathway component PulM
LARLVAVAAVCLLVAAGTYYALWSPAEAHDETAQRFFDIWRRRSAASRILWLELINPIFFHSSN